MGDLEERVKGWGSLRLVMVGVRFKFKEKIRWLKELVKCLVIKCYDLAGYLNKN